MAGVDVYRIRDAIETARSQGMWWRTGAPVEIFWRTGYRLGCFGDLAEDGEIFSDFGRTSHMDRLLDGNG